MHLISSLVRFSRCCRGLAEATGSLKPQRLLFFTTIVFALPFGWQEKSLNHVRDVLRLSL